jgi:hypothetical protein
MSMTKRTRQLNRALILATGLFAGGAQAVDSEAVIGGAVGGGVGAAVGSEVGGKDGAIVGSAIGAAIGTAVAADDQDNDSREHYHSIETNSPSAGGPPPHAYRTPPGHAKHGKKHRWKD